MPFARELHSVVLRDRLRQRDADLAAQGPPRPVFSSQAQSLHCPDSSLTPERGNEDENRPQPNRQATLK